MPKAKKVIKKSLRLLKAFPGITAKSAVKGFSNIHKSVDLANKRMLESFKRKK